MKNESKIKDSSKLGHCLKLGLDSVFLNHYEKYVINKIINCRTIKSGRHQYKCDDCLYETLLYNSCGNRHCNQCQTFLKNKWLLKKQEDMLPVEYFHMVFTIPSELHPLIESNKKLLYSLLFQASSETRLELTKDEKYLGAKIGVISTLHTWGQQLNYHPHIHCIIPSGGLSLDNTKWVDGKEGFFLPIKVMSKVFKAKFIEKLIHYYTNGRLCFFGRAKDTRKKSKFNKLTYKLRQQDWVVYSKSCESNPQYALYYLGNYTHRVAISNRRILSVNQSEITISYKDYKDEKTKTKSFTPQSFLKHFVKHILPKGFVKTRCYGYLSSVNRKKFMLIIKKLLNVKVVKPLNLDKEELFQTLYNVDITCCPKCKSKNYNFARVIRCRSPPRNKID
ncbi:MAG: IS91 family transposase [Candidatus Cloacimonetes bacterium]|nr:IS91 family transposase [Candidatus Cloacimonadota bacterium]